MTSWVAEEGAAAPEPHAGTSEVQLPRAHYAVGNGAINEAGTLDLLREHREGTSNIKRWDYQEMKGIKIPYTPVCLLVSSPGRSEEEG